MMRRDGIVTMEIWASRVRVLGNRLLRTVTGAEGAVPEDTWAKHLAADLITPHFTISEWEALADDCGATISGSLRCWL